MQKESIFVDKRFLESVSAEYSKFDFQNKTYIYRIKKREIHIISTLCSELEINEQLVEFIFLKFDISKIVFTGTYDNEAKVKKCVCRKVSDDNILLLKEYTCINDYLSSLGRKTRQHLKNYQRVLERDVKNNDDELNIEICSYKEITKEFEKVCDEIFELNKKRCKSKGFEATVHEEYVPAYREMGGGMWYIE